MPGCFCAVIRAWCRIAASTFARSCWRRPTPGWARTLRNRSAHTCCAIMRASPAINMAAFAPTQAAEGTMPEFDRIAVFGGVYSNYLALAAALEACAGCETQAMFCLGDLGAFGPHPDRVFPLLNEHGVQCIQGNYDNSIGNDLPDCQCGYADPRDNH